jgi:hypothetical protein
MNSEESAMCISSYHEYIPRAITLLILLQQKKGNVTQAWKVTFPAPIRGFNEHSADRGYGSCTYLSKLFQLPDGFLRVLKPTLMLRPTVWSEQLTMYRDNHG